MSASVLLRAGYTITWLLHVHSRAEIAAEVSRIVKLALNATQTQMLRDMGIDVWRLRTAVSGSVQPGGPETDAALQPSDPPPTNAVPSAPAASSVRAATARSETAVADLAQVRESLAADSRGRPAASRAANRDERTPALPRSESPLPQPASERFEARFLYAVSGSATLVAGVSGETGDADRRLLRDIARAIANDWATTIDVHTFQWPQSHVDATRVGAVKAVRALLQKHQSRGANCVFGLAAATSAQASPEGATDTTSDENAALRLIDEACPEDVPFHAFAPLSELRRDPAQKRQLWQQIQKLRH